MTAPVGGAASRHVMSAASVIHLLDVLDDQGVAACVGGGWAVDALLGEQTREHGDLDLWLPAADLERLFRAFVPVGVDRVLPRPGDRPWNIVLHDGGLLRVDLHLYEPRGDGTFHFGSAVRGDVFPDEALAGRGVIAGRPVPCEAVEWVVRWHTGYPRREVDGQDVGRLCARFGLRPPQGY